MRCPICSNTIDFRNVDEFRIKPVNMTMCNKCGFITYPDKLDQVKLKKHYQDDYRTHPTIGSIFSGQRKIQFHARMLDELYKKYHDTDLPVSIYDVGTAIGMFLDWTRMKVPKAIVGGSEYTPSYKRVAYHEYGLILDDEIPEDKQYDLISSYKVLEHIPSPDAELKKYFRLLKDDGHLYISVPTWFGELHNFGMATTIDLEYYYSPDHVNVWSRHNFEFLLRSCGFKIIKEDHMMYNDTYLCQKDTSEFSMMWDDPNLILEKLKAIKKAYLEFIQGKYSDAINSYPNFPTAHMYHYEYNRQKFAELGFEIIEKEVIVHCLNCCPNSIDALGLAIDILGRYQKLEKALSLTNQALELKPNHPPLLKNAAQLMIRLAERDNLPELLIKARDMLRHLKVVSWEDINYASGEILKLDSRIPYDVPIKT